MSYEDTPAHQEMLSGERKRKADAIKREIVLACVVATKSISEQTAEQWATEVMHRAHIIEHRLTQPIGSDDLTQQEIHMILAHHRPIDAIKSLRRRTEHNFKEAKDIVDAWRDKNDADFFHRSSSKSNPRISLDPRKSKDS